MHAFEQAREYGGIKMNEEYNYYELLGVSKDATREEIEFKYNEIINFLNPGSHPNKTYSVKELEEARDRMEVVTLAYSGLIDPQSRKRYDEELKSASRRKSVEYERNIGTFPPVTPIQPTRFRRSERNVPIPKAPIPNMPRQERGNMTQPSYPKREQAQKEKFFQSIKRQYKEVRSDEKRNTLKMRHSRIGDAYRESFSSKVTSVPKEILYYTGKGLTHVSLETLYQLLKLTYINKDVFTKYLIRNRRLIAVATATGIMLSTGLLNSKNDDGMVHGSEEFATAITTPVTVEPPKEEEIIEIPAYEPRIVLNRNYTIVAGDTLSRLASNANSSISELKLLNGYTNDNIYYGRKMFIPYTIDTEDLSYYTENVKVNNYTLEELAKIYETDIETLCKLNPEAIVNTGSNSYYLLSDSIVVPKFITKQEYWDLKQAKSYQ